MRDMRTPLSRVRGKGSAHGGTEHFWQQRLTAISNLVLITIFLFVVISLSTGDYASVRAAFANPVIGVGAALVIVSACVHMRLGMQTIIEDYMHGPAKWPLTIGNVFFACLIAGVGLYAIVKMSFGG
ncbi:succinate dehydrogenase, hydrophobic membrane anchor protein [Fulvimarina endophytica]|uniref:Succinate dehydrogenase hydrophobic membrane anchor subunit n=1 Tax=Fulvimarina endophytica TaxID=2293836 RepID=A0A371XA99_9HYPH|nr:succinate dehydrogenase, hydrophobic membrane anchor protein [Fulvimarina endophytica]RFC66146.1 succinate dehydrogenase, hydrophobic membrane anchor protein [Fulvimarina endophytica]